MKKFNKKSDIQRILANKEGIGFVPTMGALHDGHLSLIQKARKENKIVVVSVFVNSLQFNNAQDLQTYPRTLTRDMALLAKNKVDFAFAPSHNSMYAKSESTRISVAGLTETLCGSPRSRGPEHFKGVATVVAKLFNVVRPQKAYFGMKDFQQLRIIEKMNQDLDFGVHIVRVPTVRERDGLALSSRNQRLSPSDRKQAPKIYSALQYGGKLLRSGSGHTPKKVGQQVRSLLSAIPRARVDYVDVVDPETLQPLTAKKKPALIAAAVQFKGARLIDNVLIR